MIIWINGPFGAGKTTLSEKVHASIAGSMIYDPEHVGFLIHRFAPESKSTDFQTFPMWRRLVVAMALEFQAQFKKDLVVPMSLVEPEYINEIFSALRESEQKIYHFFLQLDEDILRERIHKQVMFPNNPIKDQEVRDWRLEQVDRCLAAKKLMPGDTVFLNSGELSPDQLLLQVIERLEAL